MSWPLICDGIFFFSTLGVRIRMHGCFFETEKRRECVGVRCLQKHRCAPLEAPLAVKSSQGPATERAENLPSTIVEWSSGKSLVRLVQRPCPLGKPIKYNSGLLRGQSSAGCCLARLASSKEERSVVMRVTTLSLGACGSTCRMLLRYWQG